jgi:hypothetical protein
MSQRHRILSALVVSGLALAVAGSAIARPHGLGEHSRGDVSGKLLRDGNGQIALADAEAQAAKRAATIDANGDGTITSAELQAYQQQQREARAAKRLARFDSNGDGVVSTEEYAVAQTARLSKLDANADGVVSADEFRAAKSDRRGGPRGPRAPAPVQAD